jgi:hypothetical protein
MITMKTHVLLLLGLTTITIGAAPPDEDWVIGSASGPWRRLFLDGSVIEAQAGLEKTFHSPVKHPDNPVLRKDKPWEGRAGRGGPYLYGTVMWDEGRLRMWYQLGDGGNRIGYAESEDGLTWTKPSLGIIEFDGSTDNNLVLFMDTSPEAPPAAAKGQSHNPSVIKQSWEKDPAKRYVLFTYSAEYRKARAAYSPDGLRWSFVPETAEKALFSSADVLNFFRDPYQQRFVATLKCGSRRGRAVSVAFSNDGLDWVRPITAPVFTADDLDNDETQIYGMPAFPYQGLYIGQPWIYHARWFKDGRYTDQRMGEAEKGSPCTVDVQLAWSWDMFNWTRPPARQPFIARGPEGAFDSGMVYTAIAPVPVGDELWFYYGGFAGPHNIRDREANIGLATLRMDGFCSLRAGDEEGWFISRREAFPEPAVVINARTGADGFVAAEILDRQNQVLEGFSRDDCVAFSGDAVRHRLTWKTEKFDPETKLEDCKLRFILRNAEMFSYLPEGARALAP